MKNAIIRTLPEAPQDNKLYGRNNAQWVEIDLSGIGTGDMNKAIYDPNLVEADVYDRSNHIGTQTSSTISDFSTAVTNTYAVQQNTAKVSFPEAPADGTAYARMNSSWVATESFTDAPADGNEYIRKNSAWRLSEKLDDSPYDGNTYGRRNGTWINIPIGVTSVNGQTGVVDLTTLDIPEGGNLYFTDSRVTNNSSVLANTAKVGITPQQANDITTNNSKVSFPEAPVDGKIYGRKGSTNVWEEIESGAAVDNIIVRIDGNGNTSNFKTTNASYGLSVDTPQTPNGTYQVTLTGFNQTSYNVNVQVTAVSAPGVCYTTFAGSSNIDIRVSDIRDGFPNTITVDVLFTISPK